jgi:hypothetical protein
MADVLEGLSARARQMIDSRDMEIHELRRALGKLIRRGTNGRCYTTQHGDADVTDLVDHLLERA